MFPRDTDFIRNISVDTQDKRDTKGNNNNNNNNNNSNTDTSKESSISKTK